MAKAEARGRSWQRLCPDSGAVRRVLQSAVDIHSTPERVWVLLTDFDSFPEWNPFITRATGRVAIGERITVHLRLFGRGGMTLRPRIIKLEPNRELEWLARMGLPGIFDVRRIFKLEPMDRQVRFHQSEICTGVLTDLLFAVGMGERILKGYERLNVAIKARAED
jgi:hypothetical protein